MLYFTMMLGYREEKSSSYSPSWSPTSGSKMNPPRSPRTRSSAVLKSSGRFFFQITRHPSRDAMFTCIALIAVPGVRRACSCGIRRDMRESSASPAIAASRNAKCPRSRWSRPFRRYCPGLYTIFPYVKYDFPRRSTKRSGSRPSWSGTLCSAAFLAR